MKKHRVVFVSKNGDFKFGEAQQEAFSAKHPEVEFKRVAWNAKPLAEIYNAEIETVRKASSDVDFLVFMHADVSLDFGSYLPHLEEVEASYDVYGLCGCSKISVEKSPLNWFTGSQEWPEARWGCVTHGELGGQTSFFNSAWPGVRDHRVVCIDGLGIALSKKACMKPEVAFDPQFSFSHYDTDFSMSCCLKWDLKLGVVVQRELQHWSVGKSILQPSFLDSEKLFRAKWKDLLKLT